MCRRASVSLCIASSHPDSWNFTSSRAVTFQSHASPPHTPSCGTDPATVESFRDAISLHGTPPRCWVAAVSAAQLHCEFRLLGHQECQERVPHCRSVPGLNLGFVKDQCHGLLPAAQCSSSTRLNSLARACAACSMRTLHFATGYTCLGWLSRLPLSSPGLRSPEAPLAPVRLRAPGLFSESGQSGTTSSFADSSTGGGARSFQSRAWNLFKLSSSSSPSVDNRQLRVIDEWTLSAEAMQGFRIREGPE